MLEISNPMDYKVALYIRLSKEDDSERESQSVTNQRSLLLDYTAKNHLDVFDTYIDDGYTGTNFDRPGFLRMIADIEDHKVNMVLTKDMSRLGRDYIQTGYYMERYFPEKRVRYISLLDGIDTGIDSTANDITPFKAILNDLYAKDISKKITSVKRDMQRKGQFIGGKASYGYKRSETEKSKIEIDKPAADVVREIFALALEGVSAREIAVRLNDSGVPTPADYASLAVALRGSYTGKWSAERIAVMLKNELYMGNMVQGRVRKINYKIKKSLKLPPEEWTIVPGTHAPIVSVEDFNKVGRLLDSRRATRTSKHEYLLKGIIHCHECGHPLGVMLRQLASGPMLYFACRTYQRFTKNSACTCHCVRVEDVTQAVVKAIREQCQRYLNRQECTGLIERAKSETAQARATAEEIETLTRQIKSLTLQLDRSYKDKLSGIINENDFIRIYERFNVERDIAEARKKKLEAVSNETSPAVNPDELIAQFLQSADTNREMLVNLVERIELTEDKQIIIQFRFRQLDEPTASQPDENA